MADVGSSLQPVQRLVDYSTRLRERRPTIVDLSAAIVSAVLLILSFPDFSFWPLAWCALVPLLVMIASTQGRRRAFFFGWVFGTLFFYGSCYWLTYSMIHTGGIAPPIAFLILIPVPALVGVFPGLFCLLIARCVRRWGTAAVFISPIVWSASEWLRLEITGQLWNALGYSQAFHASLVSLARWGGVYAVGAMVVLVNAAIAFALLRRNIRALAISSAAIVSVLVLLPVTANKNADRQVQNIAAVVVAIQPNVPMDLRKSDDDMQLLIARHFAMTEAALNQIPDTGKPRLVIWPESPMNFEYGSDSQLRARLASFAQQHRIAILLNSQEAAPNDGIYNSAVLINEEGKLVAQYDKIRLLPFGEYVPLPEWLPGAGLIRAIVGDFTPGTSYRLMPVGNLRAGVFICVEAAYPSIARRFTSGGADLLINISNDGYLGPTAVMRQHLSNGVLRAVENGRSLLSVTNTGITAFIAPDGTVTDASATFKQEVRIWELADGTRPATFYTRHGDVFVITCALFSLMVFVFTLFGGLGRARKP